tara:strand:+ start:4754 stop:5101 length:348 start_codon:yes stop_codon:yes gene_type:complete
MKRNSYLLFEDEFYDQFSADSGIIAFFSSMKNSKDPIKEFDDAFDFWVEHQKNTVQKIIEVSLDVNKNPQKYSREYQEVYGTLEVEDYHEVSSKALRTLKTKIKNQFEEFLKRTQ